MTIETAPLHPLTAGRSVAARRRRLRQVAVDTGYLLLRFPLSVAGFALVAGGLLLGTGLVLVWVGVVVLPATLLVARGLATVERTLLPRVLGRPLPDPRYVRADGGLVRRLTTPLRDPQCWLDALHAVLSPVVTLPGLVVTLVLWYLTLGGLSYRAWDWALPQAENQDLLEVLGLQSTTGRRIALYTAIGLVAALILPFALRGAAVVQAQLGRLLLTSRAATQAELGRLAGGRDAAVAAEAVALRRLERDIHDGPQQRLVRLTMDLARAQRQLEHSPEAVRATLEDAGGLARETLEELRALCRGIAPPVLADRGLAAAVSALAARSPVRSSRPSTCRSAGWPPWWRTRPTSWSVRRWQTWPSTAGRAPAVSRWGGTGTGCGWSSRTTVPAAPSSPQVMASPG